jgi:hypothetical protein
MIALEIRVNGEVFQTISADDPGFVEAFVSRGRKRHEPDIKIKLGTSAVNLQPNGELDHLEWPDRSLSVGDKIVIRIVETEQSDEPTRRYHADSSARSRSNWELYTRLKAQFARKINKKREVRKAHSGRREVEKGLRKTE